MSEEGQEFVLHDRDYHSITVVDKYSEEVQEFGPNKVVTIPEGACGVFEREGAIQIKPPGFYKVSAEYKIRQNIPLQINTERFEDTDYRTKDSVSMRLCFVVVWKVADPLMVAKFPGDLDELKETLRMKALSSLGMVMRTYNRAQLLPTRQEVVLGRPKEGDTMSREELIQDALRKAAAASKQLLQDTEAYCLEMLNDASANGGWGLKVASMKIDSLELADLKMIEDLESIAQAQLATKRKQVEGQQAVAAANVKREANMQRAKANAAVEQKKAQSEAKVKAMVAEAKNEVEVTAAKATNEINLLQATNSAQAEAEAKRIEFEMTKQMAEHQAAIEDMKVKRKAMEAECEAAAVTSMAQANYEKGCWEQEVANKMPPQELELKKLEKIVEGLRFYGMSAWRYPDEMQHFMAQLKPYLKLGSVDIADASGGPREVAILAATSTRRGPSTIALLRS